MAKATNFGWVALAWVLSLDFVGAAPLVSTTTALNPADLARIVGQAADRAKEVSPNAVIAVVDRDGRVLTVLRANGGATVTAAERAIAVSKAGTGVFLSSNEHAFSTRTAGFIIQPHFPPGVRNRGNGPLVGVGFSSLPFSDVVSFRTLDGQPVPGTSLNGSPGGLPLYKDGQLVAGIGVTGDGTEAQDAVTITGADPDEAVALAGQIGYAPRAEIFGSGVLLDGIRVPYIASETRLAAQPSGLTPALGLTTVPGPTVWPKGVLAGVPGEVRAPIRGDPVAGTINGQARLSAAEVTQIIARAAARTLVTRAAIRLPAADGLAAQMFIVVINNPAQDGRAPAVLGTFRTADAPVFSWDIAVQKARTVLFFSSATRAYSARTIGFLAQSTFPPGIENQPPGPFFGLQERFSVANTAGTSGINGNLPNGMTIFPGGFPLYRNGVLIGAIAVSGDGIEQDDLVAAAGTIGFQPPAAIRADTQTYLGARLPYAKFPRDAELRPADVPVIPPGYPVLDQAPVEAAALAAVPGDFADPAVNAKAPGDVVNLSARGWVAAGDPLILGFVTDSAAASPVLVRGIGPGLGNFGVSDALRSPVSVLRDSAGRTLWNGAGWNEAGNADAVAAAARENGAFPLAVGSQDNAFLPALAAGAYTVVVDSRDGSAGNALTEVYDAADRRTGGNLKNVSIRGRVVGAERSLTAGLVVAEGAERTVLIRGLGPALAAFGVGSPLVAPRLRLLNRFGEVVAEGSGWDTGSNAAEIAAVTRRTGAFPLAAGAADQALLVTLGPGAYTVELVGADGAAGEVLVELYAVAER